MRNLKQWLDAYGESHTNHTNIMIHKVCVPLIMLSILGMLWVAPKPAFLGDHSYINWATVFASTCMVFYILLGVRPALVMLFQVSLMAYVLNWVHANVGSLFVLLLAVFIVSWVFQFIGHKIEGKKPSFIEDLQFLLVGPLWVYRSIFLRGLY